MQDERLEPAFQGVGHAKREVEMCLTRGGRDPLIERVDRATPGVLAKETEHLGREPAGSRLVKAVRAG